MRALRERSATLPIVMVSGSPEARGHGSDAGINAFVDKEAITPHLVSIIHGLLVGREHELARA